MNKRGEIIARALSEASGRPVLEHEPDFVTILTNVFRGSDQENQDTESEAYGVLEEALGFLRAAGFGAPVSEAEMKRLNDVAEFLYSALVDYKPPDDRLFGRLRTILSLCAYLDWEDELWSRLPDAIAGNRALLEVLKGFVGAQAFDLKPYGPYDPISTEATLVRFAEADSKNDWITLGDLYPRLPPPLTGATLSQSTRCLARFTPTMLVEVCSGINQIISAGAIVQSLDKDTAVDLAVQCNSQKIKFATMFRLFENRREELSANAQNLLTSLIVQITADESLWQSWLHVFNRFPVRFPTLQHSLGLALAKVDRRARDAYIESIELHNKPHDERKLVATCLEAFQSIASLDERQALWKAAFNRWSTWNFQGADPGSYLFDVSWSAIDYAVVGYFVECVSDVDRTKFISKTIAETKRTPRFWQRSLSSFLTTRNRLISRMQPAAHAEHVIAENVPWLTLDRSYQLSDEKNDFARIRYRVA